MVDLIRLASRVGEGELYLLAGCDPNAGASDSHFARLLQKLDAGASVLESQPVFDGARFADWLTRRFDLPAGAVDPDRHVAPLAGTKEGLYLLPSLVTSGRGVTSASRYSRLVSSRTMRNFSMPRSTML